MTIDSLDQAVEYLKAAREQRAQEIAKLDAAIASLENLAPPPPTFTIPEPPTVEARPSLGKSRRYYSDDEKRRAVQLAQRVGAKAASEQLGIHRSILTRWCRDGASTSEPASPSTPTPAEYTWSGPGTPNQLKPSWPAPDGEWADADKDRAVDLAKNVGWTAAGRQTGIPSHRIKSWHDAGYGSDVLDQLDWTHADSGRA